MNVTLLCYMYLQVIQINIIIIIIITTWSARSGKLSTT